MSQNLHVGDVGTILKVYCRDGGLPVDISTATVTKNLLLEDPSGTVTTKAADFFTDGTDGILVYQLVDGDLDKTGEWIVQPQVVLDSGLRTFTERRFHVHAVLGS
jgi:hypothetical protein